MFVTGGNRPLKLTDDVSTTRRSSTVARTGVRLLFRFQGAEARARTSPGPRGLRLGVGALPWSEAVFLGSGAERNTIDAVSERQPPSGEISSEVVRRACPCAAAASGRGAAARRPAPGQRPICTPFARTLPCCSWRRASLLEMASPVRREEPDDVAERSLGDRRRRHLAGERRPAPRPTRRADRRRTGRRRPRRRPAAASAPWTIVVTSSASARWADAPLRRRRRGRRARRRSRPAGAARRT